MVLGMGGEDVSIKIGLDGVARTKAQLESVENRMQGFGSRIKRYGKVAAVGLGAVGVAAGATAAISIKHFADVEQQLAEVQKTTGMTRKEAEDLGSSLSRMAKTDLPVAASELRTVAAIAGQLGIRGTDNIQAFTETAAKMGVATALSSEEAATSFARLSNAMNVPIEQAGNMGSAINTLSNTTAANSKEITESLIRAAPAANQLGVSIQDLAGMQATLVASGMQVQRAGTRMNRAFTQMSQNTEKMAEALGLPVDKFRDIIEENPTEALQMYLDHLGDISSKTARVTEATEVFGAAGAKAVLTLASNSEGLTKNMEASNQAFEENTSLQEEFEVQSNTVAASMQILKNNINSVKSSIGRELAPVIRDVAPQIGSFLKDFDFGAAAKTSIDAVKDLAAEVKKFLDDIKPALEDFRDIWESLKGIAGDVADAFSDVETDSGDLADAVNKAAEALRQVFEWIDKHPRVTKLAVTLAVAAIAFSAIIGPVTALVGAVSGLIAFLGSASLATATLTGIVMALGGPITIIIGVIALLAAAWATNFGDIRGKTKWAVEGIKTFFAWVVDAGSEVGQAARDLGKAFRVWMGKAWTWVKTNVENIKGKFSDAVQAVKDLKIKVSTKIGNLISGANDWGRSLIQGFIDGIYAKLMPLEDAMGTVSSTVDRWLPGSDADTGPLSNLSKKGSALVETLAQGIEGESGQVDKAMQEIFSPATQVKAEIEAKVKVVTEELDRFLEEEVTKKIGLDFDVPKIPIAVEMLEDVSVPVDVPAGSRSGTTVNISMRNVTVNDAGDLDEVTDRMVHQIDRKLGKKRSRRYGV